MSRPLTRRLLAGLPLFALIGAEGCSAPDHDPAPAQTAPAAPAPAMTPGTPPAASGTVAAPVAPTADQLYQLVAPVALFPDKLLAQVLAGATYPGQIAAEADMLRQNPGLSAAALQAALTPQSWDPSVKGLASFPGVLNQMARNPAWTTALGEAYSRDPTDVMNAVQVLRQRAMSQGHLKTTPQQTVVSRTVTTQTTTTGTLVPEPESYVEIAPAQPDVVYVPSYDPGVVYGEDYGLYPGYAMPVGEVYSGWSDGLIGFGAGIAVGALLTHPWGWSHWGMHWGGPPPPGGGWGGWRAPSVVYDQRHYRVQNIQNIHLSQAFGPGGFNHPPGPSGGPHGAGGMKDPGGMAGPHGPGGMAAGQGGHWRAPQFDQRLNAHAWAPTQAGFGVRRPGQPETAGPNFAHQPGFQAHVGPDGSRGWSRQPMQVPHSHPVSYIHNDSLGGAAGGQVMHAGTRSPEAWHQSPAFSADAGRRDFARPQVQEGFQGGMTHAGFDHGNQAFRNGMHPAGQTFRPAERPAFHPAPAFRPAPAPRPAPQEHAHGGGGHHH